MRKRRGKKGAIKTEGIVVGDSAVHSEKPKTPLRNAPPIAVASSAHRQKLMKMGLGLVILVLVVSVAGVKLLKKQPAKPSIQPIALDPTKAAVQRSIQQLSVQGTIVSVAGEKVEVKTTDSKTLNLVLNSSTKYRKNYVYVVGSKSEVAATQSVQVSYNKLTNEALTVWYNYTTK